MTRGQTLCHIACNINMTGGLTLCHIACNINLTGGLSDSWAIGICWRSGSSMFSLCSVPYTCLQNAISSSAKTARPRRGALNSTYGRPALRLPGSRRALGLAKQGLKSHCKRRSGQSRCRENMELPLLTMWLLQRNMDCPLSHCIQYKADKGSDPLSHCMQHKYDKGSDPLSYLFT